MRRRRPCSQIEDGLRRRGGQPSNLTTGVLPELTSRLITQGRALVRAIEALAIIEPIGLLEHALARLLTAAYRLVCGPS